MFLIDSEKILKINEYKSPPEPEDNPFFSLSLDLLCVVGLDGHLKHLNAQWEKTLGFEKKELQDRPFLEFVHPEDRQSALDKIQELLAGKDEIFLEARCQCQDGSYRWLLWNATLSKPDGLIYAIARDIADAKQAKQETKIAVQRFEDIANNAKEWIWEIDADGKYTYSNCRVKEMLGYEPAEVLGKYFYDLFSPALQEKLKKKTLEAIAAKATIQNFVSARFHKQGYLVLLETSAAPILDEAGNLLGYRGADADITPALQAEQARQQSEALFRTIFEQVGCGIAFSNLPDGSLIESNQALQAILGYSASELQDMNFSHVTHPEDVEIERQLFQEMAAGQRQHYQLEKRYIRKDERVLWVRLTRSAIQNNQDNVPRFAVAIVEDISDRKQAEKELLCISEAVKNSSDGIGIADANGTVIYLNPALVNMLEYTCDDLNATGGPAIAFVNPAIGQQMWETILSGYSWNGEVEMRSKSDRILEIAMRADAIKDEIGKIVGFIGIHTDITEPKQAQKALEAERQRLFSLLDGLPGFVYLQARDYSIKFGNRRFQEKFGNPEGRKCYEAIAGLENPCATCPTFPVFDTNTPHVWDWFEEKTGQTYQIHDYPFTDIDGTPLVLQMGIDISDRVRAETALRQSEMEYREQATCLEEALHNLQRTQTQLVQSEKMSSLGQLVAGIAHEINNPVNFIYGNLTHVDDYTKNLLDLLQLYQQQYAPNQAIQEKAEAIELDFLVEDLPKMLGSMKLGTDRIREIVLSLRNFSRLQEADMKLADIHEGIDSTLLILNNRLKAKPDRAAIEIVKEYGQLPLVECYPGLLNQVLMNLLANAIDALENQAAPRVISIRTSVSAELKVLSAENYSPHSAPLTGHRAIGNQSVTIVIADTGSGMTEEVKARLFDPFFTTKPVGKGTGLGLSISHQIVVEKHGGVLKCVSQPGQGAEFILEIPIVQRRNAGGSQKEPDRARF